MHGAGRVITNCPPVSPPSVRVRGEFKNCMRCGACCRAVRCPLYYTDDLGRGACSIYAFRPKICIARADQDCLTQKGFLHAL